MKENLSDMLQKEVSRKEFLTTLGIGIVVMLGLSSLMRLAGPKGLAAKLNQSGSSPYGR